MSTVKQPPAMNSFLVTKKNETLLRVKEEVVSPKQTAMPMPPVAPCKLKISAQNTPAVVKKRKNVVQSPVGSECSTTSSSSNASAKKRKASNVNDDLFDINDMGSAEEKIKEMERQLLSLDPDSKEAKKKRRLIRNRMSAQLHRERKKAYVVQLEEQLQAKDDEMQALKAQLDALKAENTRLKNNDVPAIKLEPPSAFAANTEEQAVTASESGAFDTDALICDLECEPDHWDSSILNDLDSDMLEFPEPTVTSAVPSLAPRKPTEIHDSFVAKKNLAMMMAIVFSMTFFGGMMSIFDTISSASGSGFCSYFKSYSPKLLGEMSVKSRVLSDLEGTAWMDFPEMNDEPAQESNSSSDHNQYSHGIPMDDLFDDISMSFAMPLEEEEEEEEDDLMGSDNGSTSEEDSGSDSNYVKPAKLVLTKKDMSYANLTRLWCEKRSVLCTLASAGEELKHAVVDLSHVKDSITMEASFAEVLASFTTGDEDPKVLGSTEKQVLSFLYPMGVFSRDDATTVSAVLEPLPFMEVACHI
ncbi:hypothetical protein H310_08159 [Aphanomyces invadans]|uniref:BZIP domain-containing protein n=1 Tax=Aphanomyces invadans TaxID=157072 RepID=A0A024U0S3_9STRA|nr:hypothetical protein H310_08159 [Aphanomyces invadans]ETV99481.1 hypothetical protein H310_08159 [Aphanomyces invadans]|eukprot:XP_008872037.1 hypothetical protein H310_08159 [Aphanomyces invadans]